MRLTRIAWRVSSVRRKCSPASTILRIAAIYGIEEDEGTRALVLELVEGPTLADRISKGPISVDEALPIAKQIAEAVEAAHEAGVIHRDLKPANIKVREDGTVKVLDFGLAKALDTTPQGDPSQSPTRTAAATQMGVILGTAAYMSPEQASGETTDKRSDIWSFGVVLFEMLTGQRREATPMRGTEGALNPFFSPDGQWVGFWTAGQLQKVAVTGGAPVTLCEADRQVYGASWASDDTIFFSDGVAGIARVPGAGGTPELVVATEDGEVGLAQPQLLPGGDRIMFTVAPTGQVVTYSLVTGERQVLMDGGVGYVRYVPTGHLVYVQDGTLLAVPFDEEQRGLTTGPVPLVEGISQGGARGVAGLAQFAYADDGTLVYIPGSASAGAVSRLTWVDRQGEEETIDIPARPYQYPRVSPDGTRVAVTITDSENLDVWIADVTRGTLSRLTTDEASDRVPLWTPDGQRVVFTSNRDGELGLFSKAADGTGEVERLATFETATQPLRAGDWSPDGTSLVFVFAEGTLDIGVLSMAGERSWAPLLDTEAVEVVPVISPDGQWIAYASDETGRPEVYIQRFPDLGERQQVSTDG